MSVNGLSRRIGALEAKGGAAMLRFLFRPVDLSDADFPCWYADRVAELPDGCDIRVVQWRRPATSECRNT